VIKLVHQVQEASVPRKTAVTIEGRRLEFSNLDKVLYPDTGTTKADVLSYYNKVAPLLIEQAAWRPATVKRWVNGVGTATEPERGFFQKNLGEGTPDWVKTFAIQHSDHTNEYPLINDAATLALMAQLAALEIHTPQWRFGPRGARKPPDRLVIDLDPGEGVDLPQCGAVAMLVRDALRERHLDTMPVTSGSKGIHLYADLDGSQTSDEVSEFAHELARQIESENRDLVLSDMARNLRAGKVFIDWSQNNGSKTTITPFSLRGTIRPRVAAPRTWDEIASPDLRHLEYTDVLERLDLVATVAGGR
jgi:bifunctional non-homologous end joining protein LigD